MSWTGIYTTLISLEDDDRNPIIRDYNAFEEFVESEIGDGEAITTDYAIGEYPKEVWELLKGFKTWEDRDEYHLSNTAIDYGHDRFVEFWSQVGSFCEPFCFYHSGRDGGWPELSNYSVWDLEDGGEIGTVYKVLVDGEDVNAWSIDITPDETSEVEFK